ncbi:MAG TPA: hypothetical protein VKR05_04455 [Candidatus Cybelea sp.]|nr:hypothetical protein [Candidatus Cybelea sp.]
MKWTSLKLAFTTLAAATATFGTCISHSKKLDDRQRSDRERLTARAMQVYLLYVLMPLWTIPGFADYLCHRRAKIESTSGTQESITHSLMMASVAVPALQALLFETNALTLVVGAGALIFHELVVIWDVAYAAPRRHVSVTEQHFHSFLEVLPFATLSFLLCLRADQSLAILGLTDEKPDFALRSKAEPPPRAYVAGLLALITLSIGIPYAEELLRCMRVNPSPLPRPKQQ